MGGRNNIRIKIAILSVCIILLTSFIVAFPVKTVRATGNTLYVGGSGPGNYSSIQAAINDANDGDTVFVYNGTYYEHDVYISKNYLNLIGENKETTLIEGNDDTDVIKISAEGINVSGFSIRTTGVEIDYSGINIYSNHTIISGNIIFDNGWGVKIYKNSYNQIIGNIFLKLLFINVSILIYVISLPFLYVKKQ